ncbi:probable cyclic nucleotide-gated ion channel 5 [Mangifera indica]|uniref:probable cyclic nucleotide-gated ion channel 5 n=1 Tax=Mangifera indica TaxID=29780 RepID=UPI001CFC3B26|nr:probable cyclic nucleotide-gated ion channel 5 [Mangifera indica]
MDGQQEEFVRLSSSSDTGVKKGRFSIEALGHTGHSSNSTSFKKGIRKGSEGLKPIGQSLRFGVSHAVFPKDVKVLERKIFDPQDKFLLFCNKLFFVSCLLAVAVDPLFFFLPVIDGSLNCLGMDEKSAISVTTLRTAIDAFYLIRMALQFRTAFIAPTSRVFGRGELIVDPAQIAKRYMRRYFIVDFLSVLPLPQIVCCRFLLRSNGSDVLATKQTLFFIVLFQYVPRLLRMRPLTSELKRTAGVFAETALAGAAYYLLLFMVVTHVVGALWYFFALARNDTCWHRACHETAGCNTDFLYCGNQNMGGYSDWSRNSTAVLQSHCSVKEENPPFDYGIFLYVFSHGIASSDNLFTKYYYSFWWGLQNFSTLGQGFQTSLVPAENIFAIVLVIAGLILLALWIDHMETYLQSLTIRIEEMRVKRLDSDQWMHHRLLPPALRERVRRYDQYKWLETRGVDEESLVQSLPKDLRRDIKRHLCLDLVRRVPLFEKMDESLLDAICERLKPCLFTENAYIVREGYPVVKMLFIIHGRLESVTTDGGRSGFFNLSFLEEGDFCGEELLTWALDPKSGDNLPFSTRTVKTMKEVEAFALEAEELQFVAAQFRRLHSKQLRHTFRFHSHQWRTWAACFIQAAWRYYNRKKMEQFCKVKEAETPDGVQKTSRGSYSIGAALLVSRFAANSLRVIRRNRIAKTPQELLKLQKPPEPDFTTEE